MVADALRMAGNDRVRYYELGGVGDMIRFCLVRVKCLDGAIRWVLS